MFSYLWFRFGRWRRRLRREAIVLVAWSRHYLHRHIWGKWRQLGLSRWTILFWWSVLIILTIGLWSQASGLVRPFQAVTASADTPLSEGGIGEIKIINPVLPEGTSANDVNRLVFSGLTQFDNQGRLTPDLATSWQISPDGKTYTFHLRPGVRWHDGVPFTSHDVAFTLAAIQNPDSRSPLANSWQGINVDTPDDLTVVYHLPNAFVPFLDSTTQGIIPAHILESTDPAALRAANFNQKPIGTGPYQVKAFLPDDHEVVLAANPHYYAGQPLTAEFDYRWYGSAAEERGAYDKHQILAFGAVAPEDIPATLKLPHLTLYASTQFNETLLIMRNTQTVLKDLAVRQAISLTVDRGAIIKAVLKNYATPVSGPILPQQLGYRGKYQLPRANIDQATQILESAGWSTTGNIRQKFGQNLSFNLVTRDGAIDQAVAVALKQQLAQVGIDVKITAVDLTTLQQSYIRPRNYDLLLFGYNLGHDPDVYAFWDSSQAADPGLNLAAYSSPAADRALEGGRVNQNLQVRAGKYQAFQQQWQADVPAVPLYSLSYYYGVSSRVVGPRAGRLVDPTDRFYGVEKWVVAAKPMR